MQKKHHTRQSVQHQRQQRRRYPFDEHTMLCQLFKTDCFKAIDRLEHQLRPYLTDNDVRLRHATGIFLSPKGIATIKRSWLYTVIGEAIMPDANGVSPLNEPRNVFFRYLADPAHGNLGISEQTLKASVNKAVSKDN